MLKANSVAIEAFNRSPSVMLSMKEFMPISGVDLDPAFMDRFFHNLRNDMKMYITDADIEYMGFSGDTRYRKHNFLAVLQHKSNGFKNGTDYWIYSNSQYKNFYDATNEEIKIDIPCVNIHTRNYAIENDQFSTDELKYPNPSKFIGVNGKNEVKHIILTVR